MQLTWAARQTATPCNPKVLREAASTRTIGLLVGPPARADAVVRVLECAVTERGAELLVLV